ncbi:muts domain III-domain-containing protein [Mucor lusitanicus]
MTSRDSRKKASRNKQQNRSIRRGRDENQTSILDYFNTVVPLNGEDKRRNLSVKDEKILTPGATTLTDTALLTNELLDTYIVMSIKEQCSDNSMPPTFAICFVDTATAEFNLVHFQDDVHRTKFETLITQIRPRELVVEHLALTNTTISLLESILKEPKWATLADDAEFWDARMTEDEISHHEYFGPKGDLANEQLTVAMAEARKDPLLMSVCFSLDEELLSLKRVAMYDPICTATSLVLDGKTLAHLNIFQNSHDGSSTEGTLFEILDNTTTAFGKRLFKQWLCHPLRRIEDINGRLDAVEDLIDLDSLNSTIFKDIDGMPDLERLVSHIHSTRVHVNKEFRVALRGLRKARRIIRTLIQNKDHIKSVLLNQLIDQFPDITDKLNSLRSALMTRDVYVNKLYAAFNESYPIWLLAVQSIAKLDALMSLTYLLDQEKSVIEIKNLRLPRAVLPGPSWCCFSDWSGSRDSVLKGLHTGGVSTLLKQTCVAIIMAQLGGYVPAQSCRLTPCDRIHISTGATSNTLKLRSTTFIEKSAEYPKIMRDATTRSLIIS